MEEEEKEKIVDGVGDDYDNRRLWASRLTATSLSWAGVGWLRGCAGLTRGLGKSRRCYPGDNELCQLSLLPVRLTHVKCCIWQVGSGFLFFRLFYPFLRWVRGDQLTKRDYIMFRGRNLSLSGRQTHLLKHHSTTLCVSCVCQIPASHVRITKEKVKTNKAGQRFIDNNSTSVPVFLVYILALFGELLDLRCLRS